MKHFRMSGTIVAAFIALLGCCGIVWAGDTQRSPIFERVVLVPFVIEPDQFPGAPSRADQDAVIRHLSEESVGQAERSLLKKRVAGSVVRGLARDGATGGVVLSGTIHLPVSLPPNVIGHTAAFRRGRFATATFTARDAAGTTVADETVELAWGDAFWTRGAKVRRNRPLDDVLAHFVRKATDIAIQRLERRLRKSDHVPEGKS